MSRIRKAVILAAGYGTRFLPATKAMPKEMLPIVDKPAIQYVVEEAVAAGCGDIIIVTGWHKRAIEDHFDYPYELEHRLLQSGKKGEFELMRKISDMANFIYVRQKETLGDGHAVLSAAHLVAGEPFLVLAADELFDNPVLPAQQLVETFNKFKEPVVGVFQVDKQNISRYGVVDGKPIGDRMYSVSSMVEKPPADQAPSNLAVLLKYIVTPKMMDSLKKAKPSIGGEIRLIDGAIDYLLSGGRIYAREVEGTFYDIGSKLGFLKATINFGLKHEELADDFRRYLKEKSTEL
ncbi:UTP--glucose-1-phosphate uridylyltransferase [Candidatus Daviesbacteria bacterium]|nr:UTP--glucose-1-phosphate uridylyltransferase [Candidatus Daviesbacteria bacterium]